MTSTSVFQGNFAEKPSSRVIRPPGGGSSNIFGVPEEVKKPTAKPASDPAAAVAEPTPTPNPEPTAVPEAGEPAAVAAEPAAEEKSESAQDGSGEAALAAVAAAEPPAPAAPAAVEQPKKKMGYNPITGESYEIRENNVKTSISVRQPPGGASSGLW